MEQLLRDHTLIVGLLAGAAPLLLAVACWLGIREWSFRSRYRGILDVDRETKSRLERLEGLRSDYAAKRQVYDGLRKAVRDLEESLDAAEYGLYNPHFEFDTSEGYRAKLEEVRKDQKAMVKDKTAATCGTDWKVGGSRREGARMTNRYLKLVLRAFNGECDAMVQKVRWNNVRMLEERLAKVFDAISRLAEVQDVSISPRYFDLKISELRLAHEHAEKQHQEKEEQRALREQMREEARVKKEIEAAEKEALEEERRYEKALNLARRELAARSEADSGEMRLEIERLQQLLTEAHEKRERAISRAQMTKAGHVYVISNLGSFGEATYKIGMTRRLDPQDRVKELGDASVPFPFDVHAMIYAEDAPALEKQLHEEFSHRRRNGVNHRKEFFDVSLEEIEAAVEKHHGTIEFTRLAEAREFRETIALRARGAVDGALDPFGAGDFPLEI